MPEQKYKDTVQELCVKAGCKTGSILHQVCIALITQGAGQAIQSLPPINPTPQAVLVGGQGTVAVPVASTVADTVELIGGVLLMNGQQGSGGDASGSHDEAPQVARDEKDKTKAIVPDSDPKVTVIKTANMKEFFQMPFGKALVEKCQSMGQYYQGQKMYKITEKISGTTLKKGDIFYLDAQHRDHLEVFDAQGNIKTVLNLDGSINSVKQNAAQGRKIKL